MAGSRGRNLGNTEVGGDALAVAEDDVFVPGQGGVGVGMEQSVEDMGRDMFSGPGKDVIRDIVPVIDRFQDIMPSIGTDSIKVAATALAKAGRGLMLYGPPGIGKTAIAIELGKAPDIVEWSNKESGCNLTELPVVHLNAPNLNPEDLMGVPTIEELTREVPSRVFGEGPQIVKQKVTVWATPGIMDPTKPCVLFVDEPNRCDPAVRNALFQIVTGNEMASGFRLAKGSVVIAAGNRMGERSGVKTLDMAWNNRFAHLNVVPSTDMWLDWAQKEGLSPCVRAFLKVNPSWLSKSPEEGVPTMPSPRVWESVGRLYNDTGISPGTKRLLSESCIGREAAILLDAYVKYEDALPDPAMLKKNPESVRIPSANELDLAWAMSMALADQMTTQLQTQNMAAGSPERMKAMLNDPLAKGISIVLTKLMAVHTDAAVYAMESARTSLVGKPGEKPGAGSLAAINSVFMSVCMHVGSDPRFKPVLASIAKGRQ